MLLVNVAAVNNSTFNYNMSVGLIGHGFSVYEPNTISPHPLYISYENTEQYGIDFEVTTGGLIGFYVLNGDTGEVFEIINNTQVPAFLTTAGDILWQIEFGTLVENYPESFFNDQSTPFTIVSMNPDNFGGNMGNSTWWTGEQATVLGGSGSLVFFANSGISANVSVPILYVPSEIIDISFDM